MFKKLRDCENLHVALWLLKDTCWVMTFRLLGMFMVIPTLGVAIYIAWRTRHDQREFFHNLAVCAWISANSVWMTGEFYYEDSTRPIAMIFFIAGIAIVGYYYLFFRKLNAKKNTETL